MHPNWSVSLGRAQTTAAALASTLLEPHDQDEAEMTLEDAEKNRSHIGSAGYNASVARLLVSRNVFSPAPPLPTRGRVQAQG